MASISNMIRNGVEVQEREYVFWCKVDEEVLEALLSQPNRTSFLDVFLKRLKDRTRFRVYQDKTEFTKKIKNTDGGNTEKNWDMDNEVALSLVPYSECLHRVTRVNIPITNDGRPLLRKSTQEPLKWEIDVFYASRRGGSVLPWVKVELEVDNFTSERLAQLIPFSYIELIDEEKKLPEDSAFITQFWEVDSNLAN